MKRTFMKILSIAAVILLATSCIKDGDNGDSNVVSPESEVVTPNNEAKGVPFSIKAVTNVAQSKLAYADDGQTVTTKFTKDDVAERRKMLVFYNDNTVEMVLESVDDDGNGIFNGRLPVEPDAETDIYVQCSYNETSTVESSKSLEDLLTNCPHKYIGTFKYGDASVELVDQNFYAYVAREKTFEINGEEQTIAQGYYYAFPYSPSTTVTVDGLKKTVAPCKLYTIGQHVTIKGNYHKRYVGSTFKPTEVITSGWSSNDEVVAWNETTGKFETKRAGIASIIVTVNGSISEPYAVEVMDVPEGFVNLDLPSGTIWATKNLLADKPEGWGRYYAWGEIAFKSYSLFQNTFSWDTYVHGTAANALTKYCYDSKYGKDGFVDNIFVLEKEDDAAYVADHNNVMPTKEDFNELASCVWKEVKNFGENGDVYGYKVESRTNAEVFIFLPAAGWAEGQYCYSRNKQGYYWSSSLYSSYKSSSPDCALSLYFNPPMVYPESNTNRYFGCPIRPVRHVN